MFDHCLNVDHLYGYLTMHFVKTFQRGSVQRRMRFYHAGNMERLEQLRLDFLETCRLRKVLTFAYKIIF